jgi:hypothetical protein
MIAVPGGFVRIFGYSAPWRVLMLPGCFLQAWSIE